MKKKMLNELEHGEMFKLLSFNANGNDVYYADGEKGDITKFHYRGVRDITHTKKYYFGDIEVYSYGLIVVKDV